MSITTGGGTTVTLEACCPACVVTVITLDHTEAPDDMRNLEVGRVTDSGGFQPHPRAEFAMSPEVLRAIADLIDQHKEK